MSFLPGTVFLKGWVKGTSGSCCQKSPRFVFEIKASFLDSIEACKVFRFTLDTSASYLPGPLNLIKKLHSFSYKKHKCLPGFFAFLTAICLQFGTVEIKEECPATKARIKHTDKQY